MAFRPGLISPTLAAQMAATYQRVSRGRLLLNVVTGSQAAEQRRFGDHLSHDERYARTAEFLAIVRGAWSGQPFDFSGQEHGCPLGHRLCGPRAPTARANWRLAGMASAERQLHFPHRVHRPHPA